jgi:Phage tail tube protein, TTP
MSNAKVWKNVAVAMQSAIAAAITVTGISKASEGVVTAANTFVAGDIVFLEVQGMYQLDQKVARVKTPTGTNFVLEGVDTTLFDTFVSGTVAKVTLGTSITTATSISASGGDFEFVDTTTIHASQRSQIPGLPNAATFTMDNIWDVSDAGLVAMKAASDAQAKRVFAFTFGTGGQKMYFAGYVGASLLPGGSAQALVTTSSVITMFGTPTYYAS